MSGLVSFLTILIYISLVDIFMGMVDDCFNMSVRVDAVQVPSHSRVSSAVLLLQRSVTAPAAVDKLFNEVLKVLRLCVILQQIAGNIFLFDSCIISNSDK
jgi:hypothetical protein